MWNPWESQKKTFKLNNSGLSNILFRADFLYFEQKKSPSELQKAISEWFNLPISLWFDFLFI